MHIAIQEEEEIQAHHHNCHDQYAPFLFQGCKKYDTPEQSMIGIILSAPLSFLLIYSFGFFSS